MAEIWIAPKTWTVDTVLPAADLNLQVRNNFEWLKNPPTAVATITTDVTTTSTSFVLVTGLSVTLTTVGNTVLALVTLTMGVSVGGSSVYLDLHNGSGREGGTEGLLEHKKGTSSDVSPAGMPYIIDGLTPGSNTIQVHWRVSGNTGTIHATNQVATLRVVEIG